MLSIKKKNEVINWSICLFYNGITQLSIHGESHHQTELQEAVTLQTRLPMFMVTGTLHLSVVLEVLPSAPRPLQLLLPAMSLNELLARECFKLSSFTIKTSCWFACGKVCCSEKHCDYCGRNVNFVVWCICPLLWKHNRNVVWKSKP